MQATEIAAELSAALSESFAKLEPVDGGLDAAAKNFRSGNHFIKVRPNLPPGVSLTSRLSVPGVLAPLHIVELADGSHAIVYRRLDAKNGFDRPLLAEHWESAGRTLREVHESGVTEGLASETFRVEGTDTLDSSPLSNLVDAHRAQVDWLIEETLRLGQRLSTRSWMLVPCHADLHVGNILTALNGVWLVDWDTARLAPRECDLMFFVGEGILGLHGPQEEAAFFRGYGTVEMSPELIRYYRLARVLEDVVSFAQEGDVKWFLRQFGDASLLRAIQTDGASGT